MLDKMMSELCKYPNGTELKVEWDQGKVILFGEIDTIYESDNGLNDEDDGYKEYYACAFKVKEIIKNLTDQNFEKNMLVEISIENQPTLITLEDNQIIWEM